MAEISKAVIPVAGRGTRFLPLSKAVPKELFPLVDKPLIHYTVREAKEAGAREIIFITNASKRAIEEYFKSTPKLAQDLEEKKEEELLEELRGLERLAEGMTFSFVTDSKHLGDGHAILQAQKKVGEEPCFVFYPDDLIEAEVPGASQLAQAFTTAQRPVFGLSRVAQERLSSYGIVEGTSVTNRVYKLKSIVEKPAPGHAPSNLAIVGRSIITPEVFDYLKKRQGRASGTKEIRLTEAAGDMVKDGKVVYGYELKGRWWECGDKKSWMKSFFAFALKEPRFGKELARFLKDEHLV